MKSMQNTVAENSNVPLITLLYFKHDRQCTYKHNIEVHSCSHCCCGKVKSIAYSESVSVALVIQHATSIHHNVICGLSGRTIFFHIFTQMAQFFAKKIIEHKLCTLIFFTFVSETFLILKRIW
jgi:hypothetical protein